MTDISAEEPLFVVPQRASLTYCAEIAPIPRLMVRVSHAGTVFIRGQRAEIDRLIDQLRAQGVEFDLKYLSLCG